MAIQYATVLVLSHFADPLIAHRRLNNMPILIMFVMIYPGLFNKGVLIVQCQSMINCSDALITVFCSIGMCGVYQERSSKWWVHWGGGFHSHQGCMHPGM